MEYLLNFTVAGLLYDITGAVHLAFGIVSNPISQKIKQLTLFWSQPEEANPIIENKIDTISGLGLLILGFSLQVIGALGFEYWVISYIFAVLLLLFLIFYWVWFRKFLSKRKFKKFEPELKKGFEKD